MVELSLFSAIFVGACIVSGNVKDGFKTLLDTYLLNAISDVGHVYVVLFTLFLSGMVGMMQKSGGMSGFTRDVATIATTPRLGQFACFAVGCFVFFDDYANVLLAGETMRPLLDVLFISREKLAFIVDATAAPIASISPVSSWVGFEVGLIQTEIDRIIELEGTDNLSIKTSGFGVFLQSIKYRYYPIFMIILICFLIYSGRDFGPMLIAERKTRVYRRTDGGDGKGRASEFEGKAENQPKEDTPQASWNLVLPVFLLVFFIFYLLVKTGEIEGEPQNLMDKIEASDSYAALLWGTMAAAICTVIFYLLQIVQDGDFAIPSLLVLKRLFSFSKEKEEDPKPRFLMSVFDSLESFLFGMGRIFPALIVLTLAWASGAIMVAVGCDRLFSQWIVGGIAPEALPTLSFLISLFMALATGSSWGTMSILFPLILVPTWQASGGDATIFYATTAGVLSGSVAGDHISPISDTTVLSALACDCKLLLHVGTQAPYAVITVCVSILLGTVPIGYDAWPNIIGVLLGACLLAAFVFGLCPQVMSPTGNFDIFIELWMKYKADSPLHQLKADTVKAFNGEEVAEESSVEAKELQSVSDDTPEEVPMEKAEEVGAEMEVGGEEIA
jgi:Na+/H+ antiporter NhaC